MSCGGACSGDLRNPIIIEKRNDVEDTVGGSSTTWETRHEVFAKMEWREGNEKWAHGRTEAFRGWKITIRYIAGIIESDRVVFDGKQMNIKSIENVDQLSRWLVIKVTQGIAD